MTAGGFVTAPYHRPVWAEVDLGAIRHNARVLLDHARGAELMAVVKADGYGHGAVPVARAALEGGASWLAVALIEEGEELRAAGIMAPILLLSEPPVEAAAAVLAAGLTPTVYTHGFVQALLAARRAKVGFAGASSGSRGAVAGSRGAASRSSDAGPASPPPLEVHLKLDTGMHRVGLPEPGWDEAFARLAASPDVRVSGLWSHLAVADESGNPFTAEQAKRFAGGVERARAAGLRPELLHLANSGGTILWPELHLDMVRAGIALYGCEAAPGITLDDLRPSMALRAQLSLVKPLSAGEAVSYGRVWAAPVDTVVATVPAGYADGVRRGLTNVGEVAVAARRVPIAGTVCMDMFLVDLGTGATEVAGEDVWLIGGPGPEVVTAADWARWLDTITYEVTCGIGSRVPRVYLSE